MHNVTAEMPSSLKKFFQEEGYQEGFNGRLLVWEEGIYKRPVVKNNATDYDRRKFQTMLKHKETIEKKAYSHESILISEK
jgi:hypothetical protein